MHKPAQHVKSLSLKWVLLCVGVCPQAFFCGRSDYFKALLEDHFSEGGRLQSQPSTPVITLHNISHEIFIHVMYYIYTDDTEVSAQHPSESFFLSFFWNCSIKQICYLVRELETAGETENSPLWTNLWLKNLFSTARHEPVKEKSLCRNRGVENMLLFFLLS